MINIHVQIATIQGGINITFHGQNEGYASDAEKLIADAITGAIQREAQEACKALLIPAAPSDPEEMKFKGRN